MSLLGIDIGTTGCKVVAFNNEGKMIFASSAEYPLLFPRTGWIELDPELVWRKVVRCIREVATKTRRDPVSALAVSAQGEAFIPVDARGNALYSSIVTFDSRAETNLEFWRSSVGALKIFRTTGIPLSAMATLLKIQWLMENKPGIARKVKKFLCFQDYFALKIGLQPAIDYSLAARTMAFDINTCSWSNLMLRRANIEQDQMAKPVPSGVVVGDISPLAARTLGLPKGALVVAGGHDQPCGAFGAGVVRTDEAMYATGTVECIVPVFSKPHATPVMMRNNLCNYPHVVRGKFVSLAFNFTGGSLLRWYRDTFGGNYNKLIRGIPSVPTGVMVLPHFTMTGTPYFDTRSKGVIAGLQLSTKKGEITRALLEGVTFEMKLNVELLEQAGIRIKSFRAIGGGSKSSQWMQIKAEIMNRPVHAMEVTEAACLGAAMLAGIGAKVFDSPSDAVRACVRLRRTYRPRKRVAELYAQKFELYRRLYPAMRDILHHL
ncbi:MAG TPA: FGGY-family carbohydrate kinase [Bacteroidota bacterium]